jgi:hypothetical protein
MQGAYRTRGVLQSLREVRMATEPPLSLQLGTSSTLGHDSIVRSLLPRIKRSYKTLKYKQTTPLRLSEILGECGGVLCKRKAAHLCGRIRQVRNCSAFGEDAQRSRQN